jgi:hypothetical protein
LRCSRLRRPLLLWLQTSRLRYVKPRCQCGQ